MGISEKLTSKTAGSFSRSDGRSFFASSTLSLTFVKTSSISVPGKKYQLCLYKGFISNQY